MKAFFNLFKKISAVLLALLLSVVSIAATKGPLTFSPVDAENIKLNLSVIADTHISYVWDGGKTQLLIKGLKDMSNAQIKSDAFIMAGDLTEVAQKNEYFKLGSALNLYCNADNMLLEMGNHDVRGIRIFGEVIQSYKYNAGKYFEFLDKTTGTTEDTVYFYKIIKGCYFIILNSEDIEVSETYISDTQIKWLDGLLEQASMSGNPVFIVNHQPLADIGDESVEIEAVMQKYNEVLDIFFMTGHWHTPFNENTITNNGTIYFVNLPSYDRSVSDEYPNGGTGFQVELYENDIVFRARDYLDGKWLSEYDRTIDLINR